MIDFLLGFYNIFSYKLTKVNQCFTCFKCAPRWAPVSLVFVQAWTCQPWSSSWIVQCHQSMFRNVVATRTSTSTGIDRSPFHLTWRHYCLRNSGNWTGLSRSSSRIPSSFLWQCNRSCYFIVAWRFLMPQGIWISSTQACDYCISYFVSRQNTKCFVSIQ